METEKMLSQIYAPKDLESTKLPKRVIDLLESNMNKIGKVKGYRMRLLLHGTKGTGKTTIARIITKTKKLEPLYTSGSNDFNLDKMRELVYPFCNTFATVVGGEKVLIIDEFERIKPAIQDAFKILLDQTKVHCIFITNHIDDIIPEVADSRMTKVDFNFKGNESAEQQQHYALHFAKIIKEQKIQADGTGLQQLVKLCFPDFRKGIDMLQQFVDTKQPLNAQNMQFLTDGDGVSNVELYEILTIIDDGQFFTKASEYKGREEQTFQSLCNPFFLWLNSKGQYKKTILSAVVVGKWGNKFGQSPNKWVPLLACLSELRIIMLR